MLLDDLFESAMGSVAHALARIRRAIAEPPGVGNDPSRLCYARVGYIIRQNPGMAGTVRLWGLPAHDDRPCNVAHADLLTPDGQVVSTDAPETYDRLGWQYIASYPVAAVRDGATLQEAFRRPHPGDEHDEVLYQLAQDRDKPFLPNHVRDYLTTLRDPARFRAAVRRGHLKPVRPQETGSIGNAGGPLDQDTEKAARVAGLYQSGAPITTPIVLHHQPSGERWLLAGHHRLAYNAQRNGRPTTVLHLSYGAR